MESSARVLGACSVGYRFDPTDHEIILYYLNNKVHGRPLPPGNPVMECNLYENEEIWRNEFDKTPEKSLYFFSKLKTKTERGSRIGRITESGTWKNQKDEKIYIYEEDERSKKREKRLIGSKRLFTLIANSERTNSINKYGWIMHEYRLDGLLRPKIQQQNEYVLCRIKKKKKKHYGKAGKLENDTHFNTSSTATTAARSPSNLIPSGFGVEAQGLPISEHIAEPTISSPVLASAPTRFGIHGQFGYAALPVSSPMAAASLVPTGSGIQGQLGHASRPIPAQVAATHTSPSAPNVVATGIGIGEGQGQLGNVLPPSSASSLALVRRTDEEEDEQEQQQYWNEVLNFCFSDPDP